MKAIGAKPMFILSMFLNDAVFIGFIGACIGIAFGISLAYLLSTLGALGGGIYCSYLSSERTCSSMAYVTNRNQTGRTFSSLESIASITTNSYARIMDNSIHKMRECCMNISEIEAPLIVVAKTCGCREKGRNDVHVVQ